MAVPARRRLSYAEYLELERSLGIRHEFLGGDVVAMAGGTIRHAALKTALTLRTGMALLGRPCRPYDSDLKIRVPATGLASYPDLAVIYGPPQPDSSDRNAAVNPTAWFEVLSGSTERWDRGDKFFHARHLESLRHYVLVSVDRPRIEVYTRRPEGWVLCSYGPGEQVELSALGITLDLDELYAGLPEPSAEDDRPPIGPSFTES